MAGPQYPTQELITPAQLLAFVGVSSPSEADNEWAGAICAAISDYVPVRLDWPALADGETAPADWPASFYTNARLAASEVWRRRDAPFGTTGFTDLQTGGLIRLARDWLEGVWPMFDRYANVAGGIA